MVHYNNRPMVELRRSLGLFDAFAIGVGAIVGAGIFVVIGVSASLSGPACWYPC